MLRASKVRGKAKSLEVPAEELAVTFRADVASEFDREGNPRDTGERWLSRIFTMTAWIRVGDCAAASGRDDGRGSSDRHPARW